MHLIDVLEGHAQQRADAPALHFLPDGLEIAQTLSFGALHRQAQRLAAALQARYVPGERVLLALPSGPDFVLAFCACVYADLVAVPLFPPLSRKPRHLERLRNVVTDAAPILVLGPQDAQEALAEVAAADVLTVAALRAQPGAPWSRPASHGETIAFLQYTSGSTGTPKGVVVRQRNLLANLELMRRAYGFDARGRMVNWLPLYHDMGLVGGLLAPLYAGMPCYLMPPQTFVKTPSAWLQALSRHRGTASFAPNFAYALCNRTASDALIAQLDLSAWQHAINGAEPIHAATLEAFRTRFAAAGFRAAAASPGYGQAEATLCVSATPRDALPVVLRLDKAALEAGCAVPAAPDHEALEFVACGYAQPGHEVAIVDPHSFARCGPGRIGEIWLAGPSNAEAYWRRPQASSETFEARIAGEAGVYLRSGDLGFLHEGQLVVCGRLKDLVILNGRNLYPHDIEFAITDAEPGIRAGRVAAFSLADAALGREKLVVVAEPHRRFVEPARHAALYASLQQAVHEAADCAVDLIVLIEAGTIPMTTSGKISRQGAKQALLAGMLSVIATSADAPHALPALDAQGLREGLAAGEDAQALCRAYLAHTLRTLHPDLRPDFEASLIALGLDSIGLAALAARLQAELGWTPSLPAFFGDDSLSDWANALQRHVHAAGSVDGTGLVERATQAEVRQSYAQRRLWFAHRLEPGSAQHNVVIHLGLSGPLDPDGLEARLNALVARHAVLRTVYRDHADGPAQRVLDGVRIALPRNDLRSLSVSAQQDALQDCIARERATPFDLGSGPVLRARLLSRAENAHDLLLSVHHIAFDGRSAELLLGELAGGEASRGPRYANFAAWEAAHWTAEAQDTELAFWRGHLEGMPPSLDLGERGATESLRAFSVPAALCERIARVARSRRMTLFMALLGLYQLVLQHASGQDRFVIGTDVAGRPPRFDDTIGFFVNQLPLRCELEGDPTLGRFFERVRGETLAAYAHQALPFDLLVSGLATSRLPGRAPLFQVKLNYQPARAEGLALGQARVTRVEVAQALGDFDLVLDLVHGREGIDATLKHRLAAERAERVQHLWLRLLAEFEPLLEQPLSALRTLLQGWDHAWQHERRQAQAAAARGQLALARRRPLAV